MRISGTEPSSVIISYNYKQSNFKKLKSDAQKVSTLNAVDLRLCSSNKL